MILRFVFIGSISISSWASLQAQITTSETIVTASRYEEEITAAPHITEVISAEEFQEQSFRTVPESFTLTPGVSVQKTANAQGSPFIRGFTGRQNLFLIDGIRFNNSTFRSGPIQYLGTCLLYTSPSPRDQRGSRMPSSA